MNNDKQETITTFSFGEPSSEKLREHVSEALQCYFKRLGGTLVTNLYDMVLTTIEEPLLKDVMKHVRGNQSRAAVLLGLSRGTFRKKLVRYGMLKGSKGSKN